MSNFETGNRGNRENRESLASKVSSLSIRVETLSTEFKYFRNTFVGLYVTTIAPLLLIVFNSHFGG
jgi:hypothetical protein